MHDASYAIMSHLVDAYVNPDLPLYVLDVGSRDVNGSYRPLFARPAWRYDGADMVAGPNVDIVLKDPYHWVLPDGSYDLVISGQTFEHVEFFWLTWLEMVRTVKPGGMIFLIAPSKGRVHRHPTDCWRFYPDSMRALALYGEVDLLAAETLRTNPWGDTVGVFRKPAKDRSDIHRFNRPSSLILPQPAIAASRGTVPPVGRHWRTLKAGLLRSLTASRRRHKVPDMSDTTGLQLVNSIIAILRRAGIGGLVRRVLRQVRGDNYAQWVKDNRLKPADTTLIRQAVTALAQQPVISVVVPVYNTPMPWLRACLDSVLAQLYPHWELCIADDASTLPYVRAILAEYAARDARVKVVYRAKNGHVCAATNSALELAGGEFLAFVDHDDTLEPHALYMVAETLNQHPDADLIYTDHDRLDRTGRRCEPRFKPGWSPDMLRAGNYINHLAVLRTTLVAGIGGLRPGLEGAQDHDLLLRSAARTTAERIHHIPHILYHWRKHPDSISGNAESEARALSASHRAVSDTVRTEDASAKVDSVTGAPFLHHIRYTVPTPAPLVSVIIPTRDRLDLLQPCLDSLRQFTHYPALEVIVVDNDSKEQATRAYLADLALQPGYRVIKQPGVFNYSTLNNYAVSQATGELLCFLNNDIVIRQPDWLQELVGHALRPGIGAAGPLLRYPDGRTQHGGIVLGDRVVARMTFDQAPGQPQPSVYQLMRVRNVAALTGACLVMRRAVFAEVGGFDAALAVAHNDIDLCLRLRSTGYWLVFTPFAELVHIHSASRGPDDAPAARARLNEEAAYLRARWGAWATTDPFLNPNTQWQGAHWVLRFPSRAHRPWMKEAS